MSWTGRTACPLFLPLEEPETACNHSRQMSGDGEVQTIGRQIVNAFLQESEMRRILAFLLVAWCNAGAQSYQGTFTDATMRIDLYHTVYRPERWVTDDRGDR
jgi:hypothetical protein